MRCSEVVFAVLNDPTRVEVQLAAAHRAFADARRMLRKNPDRLTDFIRGVYDINKNDEGTWINGPVHGLVRHAAHIGVVFIEETGNVYLNTPLGDKINLCTEQQSHFNCAIRETCRYAHLAQLQARVEGKKRKDASKPDREDMVGLTPCIDLAASMQVCRSTRKVEGICTAADFLQKGEDGKY